MIEVIEGALTAPAAWVAAHPALTTLVGVVLIAAVGAVRGVLRAVQALAVVVVLAGLGVLVGATDVLESGVEGVIEAVQDVLSDAGR